MRTRRKRVRTRMGMRRTRIKKNNSSKKKEEERKRRRRKKTRNNNSSSSNSRSSNRRLSEIEGLKCFLLMRPV